jgi:plastocyanin
VRARQIAVFAAFVAAACAPVTTSGPTQAPAKPTGAPPSPAAATAPAVPSPAVSPVAVKPAGSPVAEAAPACGAPNPASSVASTQPAAAKPKPAASPAPGQAAPSPQAAPKPTPTLRPAPTEDRVGFPDGYQQTFTQFYVFDRTDTRQVRYVCANDVAASVKPGEAFPHGSILVFESWAPQLDADNNLVRDANGHLVRQTLNTIFVMRKEPGFGEAYGPLRNGDWEYVAYRPDKTHQTAPAQTANCAACHTAAGPQKDWVFRADVAFRPDSYGQTPQVGPNEIAMSSVTFAPRTLSVKAGTTITWTNAESIPHTVTANDRSFDSGVLQEGGTFSHMFDAPGTFEYICAIHPEQMRADVTVTP